MLAPYNLLSFLVEAFSDMAVHKLLTNLLQHPSGKGSDVVQAAFVKAVLCSGNPFSSYIKNTTATVLGYCA